MKSRLLLFFMLVFGATAMYGQDEASITELLSRMDENHMGRVYDVFTEEELTRLRDHLNVTNDDPYVAEGGGKTVFAPENNVTDDFGWFTDAAPDVFNPIMMSDTADFDGAGCYNPFSGLFFVIDSAGNAYDVNPITGVYVFLGVVAVPAGESVTGLEFDGVSSKFYAISTDGTTGQSTFFSIDEVSLVTTPIGNTGLMVPIALAVDEAGTAYTYDIDDDMLYSLDLGTGVPTPIGSIGFDADFGQGMFLNPTSGNLYMTAFNGGTFQSELRWVDTTTGNTTSMGTIGSTTPGGTTQFAWASTEEDPLSVEDIALQGFTMYPNPAGNRLNLAARNQIDSVVIYNMLGMKVLEQEIGSTNAVLDVSNLKTGSYIATVSGNGAQVSQLFVKN